MKLSVKKVFSWIFGILFLLAGLGALGTLNPGGIIFLGGGLLLLPPIRDKINLEMTTGMVVLLIIGVFIFGGAISATVIPEDDSPQKASDQDQTNVQNNDESETHPSENESQKECVEDWECTEWGDCSQEGVRTRTCTDNNDCDTTKNKPAEEESCEPEPKELTLDVGESAETHKLKVTVNSAELKKYYTYTSMGYTNQQTAPSGEEYLIADVKIENVGDSKEYITSGDFSAIDSESYRYDTGVYLGEMDLIFKELYSGDKIKGKILFEVPDDAEGLKIRYDFGFWDVELANWEVSS